MINLNNYKRIAGYGRRRIAELETPNHDGTFDHTDWREKAIENHKLIAEACEKQIAIRPLGYDNEYEEWLECPKCSESIPEYTEENETECYCLKCGQKLDWSEEE